MLRSLGRRFRFRAALRPETVECFVLSGAQLKPLRTLTHPGTKALNPKP